MLIMTARVSKTKIICGILGVLLIFGIVFFLSSNEQTATVFESNGVEIHSENMGESEARKKFLTDLGWQVEESEFMEVQVPREFDEVYIKYNEMQKAQGMNLEKYRGKRAMRYTYKTTNHPSGEEDVRINLLVYKNKLIAGDVCSTKADGFMHGLEMNNATHQ